jgi:hypothetical protein
MPMAESSSTGTGLSPTLPLRSASERLRLRQKQGCVPLITDDSGPKDPCAPPEQPKQTTTATPPANPPDAALRLSPGEAKRIDDLLQSAGVPPIASQPPATGTHPDSRPQTGPNVKDPSVKDVATSTGLEAGLEAAGASGAAAVASAALTAAKGGVALGHGLLGEAEKRRKEACSVDPDWCNSKAIPSKNFDPLNPTPPPDAPHK